MSEYKMPSLGADMKDAILVEWYVKPGDTVRRGDIIADLETDKGDIDAEVYEDGIIEELIAKPGDKLPVGTVMAIIRTKEDKLEVKKEEKPAVVHEMEPVVAKPQEFEPAMAAFKTNGRSEVKASPLARKMAEDLSIDLSEIKGTGEGGVIHKADIEDFTKKAVEKPKEVKHDENLSQPEIKKSSSIRMRQAIAAAMSKSNNEIPHYYLESQIDMSASLDWLGKENGMRSVKDRLLPIVLQVKAMARALTDIPEFNGYWQDEQLQIQEAVNIGLTISLRQGGLVVPAILNADIKSLDEIMADIMEITQRTRAGKLKTSDLIGTTITLTNLGERGVKTVYGVIYPPQVAIVGMGKISDQPWVAHNMLGIKPILNITLAGDHRATDGHLGGRFLQRINEYLQNPETL